MNMLAEEWGRGMNFRNVVVNETLRFILKWKIYENNLVPEEKETWGLKQIVVGGARMMWSAGEWCGREEKVRGQEESPQEGAGERAWAADLKAVF